MTGKTLAVIPVAKIERFLTELANLRGDSQDRFLAKYGDWFGDLPTAERWLHPAGQPFVGSTHAELEKVRLRDMQAQLQCVWRRKTLQAKQFQVMLLSEHMRRSGKWGFLLSPAVLQPGPFAQALLHLLNSADRAIVCGNPGCRTQPFFFRKKNRQTYCSETCAEFGQREAKKKWWAAKGEAWRKHRQMQKAKQQPKRKGTADVVKKAR